MYFSSAFSNQVTVVRLEPLIALARFCRTGISWDQDSSVCFKWIFCVATIWQGILARMNSHFFFLIQPQCCNKMLNPEPARLLLPWLPKLRCLYGLDTKHNAHTGKVHGKNAVVHIVDRRTRYWNGAAALVIDALWSFIIIQKHW